MIAKSILCLMTPLLSVLAMSQSISTKSFQNYIQVASDFNIQPPEMEYGYPFWYDYDSLPTTAVIFLKNELTEPIVKLNDSAYVAKPTVENAKEIAMFSGKAGWEPKYLIIPDTSLIYYELRDFKEALCGKNGLAQLYYFSNSGYYFKENYWHMYTEGAPIGCIYSRDFFAIRMNELYQCLVEDQFQELDSINQLVYHYYSDNIYGSSNSNSSAIYRVHTLQSIDGELEKYHSFLEDNPKDYILKQEISKLKRMKTFGLRYHRLIAISKFALIYYKIQGNMLPVGAFYQLANQFVLGLFTVRNEQSIIRFKQSYEQLFATRQFDKIDYINFQFEDLLCDYQSVFNYPEVIDLLPK